MLEEEFNTYQKLLDQGKSQEQALQILHLQEVPKTGPENFAWLQQLWNENGWTMFADYLRWYNNLDVNPMIIATEKMNAYYKDMGIDFMHETISLPCIAKKTLFNSVTDSSVEFHLFIHSTKSKQ